MCSTDAVIGEMASPHTSGSVCVCVCVMFKVPKSAKSLNLHAIVGNIASHQYPIIISTGKGAACPSIKNGTLAISTASLYVHSYTSTCMTTSTSVLCTAVCL